MMSEWKAIKSDVREWKQMELMRVWNADKLTTTNESYAKPNQQLNIVKYISEKNNEQTIEL